MKKILLRNVKQDVHIPSHLTLNRTGIVSGPRQPFNLTSIDIQSLNDECIALAGRGFTVVDCYAHITSIYPNRNLLGQYYMVHNKMRMNYMASKKKIALDTMPFISNPPQGVRYSFMDEYYVLDREVLLCIQADVSDDYSMQIYNEHLEKEAKGNDEAMAFCACIKERHLDVVHAAVEDILSDLRQPYHRDVGLYGIGIYSFNDGLIPNFSYSSFGLKPLNNLNECYGLSMAIVEELGKRIKVDCYKLERRFDTNAGHCRVRMTINAANNGSALSSW